MMQTLGVLTLIAGFFGILTGLVLIAVLGRGYVIGLISIALFLAGVRILQKS